MIIDINKIVILPFDGQFGEVTELKEEARMLNADVIENKEVESKIELAPVLAEAELTSTITESVVRDTSEEFVRSKSAQPRGTSLANGVLGINDILNPKIKKEQHLQEVQDENDFNVNELENAWLSYANRVKMNGRDRLHAILSSAKVNVRDKFHLSIEINPAQQMDIDGEKEDLLASLRQTLRNKHITFQYTVREVERVDVMDSKSAFEKLTVENPALEKFRKLFQLDIEY